MAKMQQKMQSEKPDDGMREKNDRGQSRHQGG